MSRPGVAVEGHPHVAACRSATGSASCQCRSARSWGDLVKGFEVAKANTFFFDKDDFEKVKLESARIIDIEKFVPAESIDRLYWDTPYHLVSSRKTGPPAAPSPAVRQGHVWNCN